MQHSTKRILTTHAGSLPRPADLLEMLAAKEQGKEFDPETAAKIQQMQQQIKELEGIAGKMHEQIQTDGVKVQGDLQKEQMRQSAEIERVRIEADRDLKLQQMKDATAIAVAHLNAETKGILSAHTAQDEAIALDQQHAHEAIQADLDRQHEAEQTEIAQQHQVGMAAADTGASADQAEADRQAAADQAAQQTEAE